MAKRRDQDFGDPIDRLFASLDAAPPGLHDVAPPNPELPSGLPETLIELYARCDGARIYGDSIEIAAAAEVVLEDGRWRFATWEGDAIALDVRGRVWRSDASIDDAVCEATRLDRWLAGAVDSQAMLFDHDGEFADDVFDDDGELLLSLREKRLRAQLKRDQGAPGPRWRLAHVLVEQGAAENARDMLEQVVADDPAMAWAWLDLARISEKIGEMSTAIDEARMAADAAEGLGHPQAGYFWAQLARLAVRGSDELVSAEAATKVSLLAPTLKQAQLSGARESLAAGDRASAEGLVALLKAVWPRDLEVLDLAKQLDPPRS